MINDGWSRDKVLHLAERETQVINEFAEGLECNKC